MAGTQSSESSSGTAISGCISVPFPPPLSSVIDPNFLSVLRAPGVLIPKKKSLCINHFNVSAQKIQ